MAVPIIKRKKNRNQAKVLCVVSFCLFTMALYLYNKTNVNTTKGVSKSIRGDPNLGTPNNNSMDSISGAGDNIDSSGSSSSSSSSSLPDMITLKTSEGDLRIKLRPDLALASVQYIKQLLDDPSPCDGCSFYRAEKKSILQGVLKKKNVKPNRILGDCPEGLMVKTHDCPKHDPNCGCHGPVMTQGMVAWAAGKGGPDFFIDTDPRLASWWNTDHTVWGELADKESLDVAMGIYDLPSTKKVLRMIDKPVPINIISSP